MMSDDGEPFVCPRCGGAMGAACDACEAERIAERKAQDDHDTMRAHGIPWPLIKAASDPFDYAVGLRHGGIIFFERCEFDKDYVFVTLLGVKQHSLPALKYHRDDEQPNPFTFDRGIAVRIVDIVWAADAPWGS